MSTEELNPLGAFALALAKAQGQMRKALRDSTNPHFQSKFADLESVQDACREALSANGLCYVQKFTKDESGERVMRTKLIHVGGHFEESDVPLFLLKIDMQALGAASTYARRFGLAAAVGVSQTDDDGNKATEGPPIPAATVYAERLSKAASLDEVERLRADIGQHINAYSPAQKTMLGKARDAALLRLTPKPTNPTEAIRQGIAAALRAPEDEPPSDDALAAAILAPLLAANPKDEAALSALWATATTSPAYRSATEGARKIAEETVEGVRDAMRAEAPKTRKGGGK